MKDDTSPASLIDHTILQPLTTESQVEKLCEEAVEFGFAAVCVPPSAVSLASRRLYGSDVKVATVVGFPCGYETKMIKAFQARHAVLHGADEIDMVINLGQAVEQKFTEIENEIAEVIAAAERKCVKVILECCHFDARTKVALAETAIKAGAAFVKTSTGFARKGATVADVRLLVEAVAGRAGVKAAGGIKDLTTCQAMIAAGATRIGTSSGVAIMQQWLHEACRP